LILGDRQQQYAVVAKPGSISDAFIQLRTKSPQGISSTSDTAICDAMMKLRTLKPGAKRLSTFMFRSARGLDACSPDTSPMKSAGSVDKPSANPKTRRSRLKVSASVGACAWPISTGGLNATTRSINHAARTSPVAPASAEIRKLSMSQARTRRQRVPPRAMRTAISF
jgi:hypothetical protein